MQTTEDITPRELRQFGMIFAGMIALFFGLLVPWIWGYAEGPWPWAIAGGFFGVAAVWPRGLAPVYKVWMKIAHALGWLNTRLILGILFYGIISPMGLVMRLFGKDPMKRRHDPDAASYRVESHNTPPERLEKPF